MKYFTLVVLLIYSTQDALGECKSPRWQKVFAWLDSASDITMAISIPIEDFAPETLGCLAVNLKQQYRDRSSIDVFIFSSKEAAKHYQPGDLDLSPKDRELKRELRAIYHYNRTTPEEYVILNPLGIESGDNAKTQINLPFAVKPTCRLQMKDRCLLALKDIYYPASSLRERASGVVTLTGTIDRSGKMIGVRSVKVERANSSTQDAFLSEAINNLKTWRFERARRQDTITISYSFGIDATLRHGGSVDVRFDLPKQIVIRANPSK